jgi:hypothetical protein
MDTCEKNATDTINYTIEILFPTLDRKVEIIRPLMSATD